MGDAEPGENIGSPSKYWTPNACQEEDPDVKSGSSTGGPLHSLITRKQNADLSFQMTDRPVPVLATVGQLNQPCQDEVIISDQGRGEDSGANEPSRGPHSLQQELALSMGTA